MDASAVSRQHGVPGPASLGPLEEALERLGRAPAPRAPRRRWQPELALAEDDDQLVVRVDLPYTRAEQVRVRVADDLLTLEADRRAGPRGGEQNGFVRSFLLPVPVRPEAVDAVLAGGVLTVKVDKRRQPRARRVRIT